MKFSFPVIAWRLTVIQVPCWYPETCITCYQKLNQFQWDFFSWHNSTKQCCTMASETRTAIGSTFKYEVQVWILVLRLYKEVYLILKECNHKKIKIVYIWATIHFEFRCIVFQFWLSRADKKCCFNFV